MLTHRFPSPTTPKRVVVIGAAGFVGGAVVRRLVAANVKVLPLGRRDVDLLAPDATPTLVRALRANNAIVFASARAPCRDIGMMVENMIHGPRRDRRFRGNKTAHVVNISSDAVYGDEPVPITEATAAAPTTMHGAMHLAREIAMTSTVGAIWADAQPVAGYS